MMSAKLSRAAAGGLFALASTAMLSTPAFAAAEGHGPVNPWVALAYLISGIFFILALRGLSSPTSAASGNRFGMLGILIAAITTLVFALFVEMVLVPARNAGLPTIVSANLGIVLAYCGLQLYWLLIAEPKPGA